MNTDARIAHDRDLLERRLAEMEAEIGHLGEELSHANRLATMGILAGMIVHEFNNVLTPVLSYAHLALHAPEDRELVTKALTRIIGGTEQVSRVASAILGFIRSDDQLGLADVNHVLDEAITCLGRKPERHRINITRDLPEGLRVSMSPVCLQQVLLNLLINAIEAMSSVGGGEIHIASRPWSNGTGDTGGAAAASVGGRLRDPVGRIVLSVSDNGPGMPPEFADRAFDLFTSMKRVEPTRPAPQPPKRGPAMAGPGTPSSATAGRGFTDASDAQHGGHGLGLAICRRLVEEAGGQIWLDTTAGRGTAFHIALKPAPPLSDAEGKSGSGPLNGCN